MKAVSLLLAKRTENTLRVSQVEARMTSQVYSHYENTPMHYTAIFHGCKNDNFQMIFLDYFHIFAQNIYMFYSKIRPEDQWSCKRSPDILA